MLRPSFRPTMHGMSRLMGRKPRDVLARAADRWEVAPASTVHVRPALMTAEQLGRIRGAEFGSIDEVVRDFRGGFDSLQAPTIGHSIRNVLLMDGVLYAGDAARHLRPGAGRRRLGLAPRETSRAAMYESWVGNRWFGNWLVDDCLSYRLAEQAGIPTASARAMPAKGHQAAYERRLEMAPVRTEATLFDELVLFEDHSHNAHKRGRSEDMRRRLIGSEPPRHPGVYLLRGSSGDKRLLSNEREIAEHLAARHGFTVIDPLASTLEEIVAACAGALVVAGVEGSQLVHGLVMMPPEARALVIQPPSRAVAVLKLHTDRQGQDYSLVVGTGADDVFHAEIDEIDRTLDLA